MKGMVFVELTDFLEQQFGYDMVDDLIESTELPSNGVYTRVGTYPHTEVVALVEALAKRIDAPAGALYKAFGEYLFSRLAGGHPEFLRGADDPLAFLRTIDAHIHVQVRKLYPDAELPSFEYPDSDVDEVVMVYRSSRGFADLAEGLIHGCMAWFETKAEVIRENITDDGTFVKFRVRRAAEQHAA